ncbi:hypothetical protein CR157_20475 [Halomonas sp. LBP4]|nr:hypothetical protein CR157_20475 [Halomonas sp. LBP4]
MSCLHASLLGKEQQPAGSIDITGVCTVVEHLIQLTLATRRRDDVAGSRLAIAWLHDKYCPFIQYHIL